MRGCPFIVGLLVLSQPGVAQVTVVAPGSNQGQAARPSNANYGPPQVIDLDALNAMPESYQRTQVIVEGEFR